MANLEIERKFLVSPSLDLKSLPILQHKRIVQAYIYNDKYTEIRVRSIDTNNESKYYYTVKISGDSSLIRAENEFEISKEIFASLIKKIIPETYIIIKDRYNIQLHNNLVAELDYFCGELEGLQMVEVEFPSEIEASFFEKPDWFLEDVTSDKKYKNKNLAKKSTQINKTRKKTLN